jgi:hypothetical protein
MSRLATMMKTITYSYDRDESGAPTMAGIFSFENFFTDCVETRSGDKAIQIVLDLLEESDSHTWLIAMAGYGVGKLIEHKVEQSFKEGFIAFMARRIREKAEKRRAKK